MAAVPAAGAQHSTPYRSVAPTELYALNWLTILAALIQGFFSSKAIAFSAQFTLRCRCTGALLAWTRLCPCKLLSPT